MNVNAALLELRLCTRQRCLDSNLLCSYYLCHIFPSRERLKFHLVQSKMQITAVTDLLHYSTVGEAGLAHHPSVCTAVKLIRIHPPVDQRRGSVRTR